ncbi:MAG TPA: VacB/RNase II family 3'-5' exoribonuclease [Candidatus Cloacimonadota bacterium]|nr:VacB/RNase II family 3'-5' exoribonuclease [Candidatus Cloacimonadota bacterium]
MEKEIIRESLIKFLVRNNQNAYTANQCSSAIGLKKADLPDVQSVLNELVQSLIVFKTAKKYNVNPEYAMKNKAPEIEKETEVKEIPFGYDKKMPLKAGQTPNEIVTGIFDATPLAKNFSFAYILMDNDDDIMISSEDTLNAYHQDTVEVEVIKKRGNKRYGIVRKVIERKKTRFVGTVNSMAKKNMFFCDSFKIHTPFQIIGENSNYEGKKVIIEIENWGNKLMNQLPSGKIVEVLGQSGLPEVELMAVIRDFDLPLEFPEDVIKEAIAINDKIEEADLSDREDYRNLFTITIDPVSAKDFDDAISLEELSDGKIRLYVHIADVAHYIKFNSEIYKEALNRGNSYYFPKKVIPMLPEILSNKICSLRPEEEKLTVTVITDFDNSGQITFQDVKESVINSNARLTYEEVDQLFEGEAHTFDENMVSLLNAMRKLSALLSKKRVKLGYLRFDLPEVEYVFDDEGYLIDLKRSRETDSHTLIENFMLIANEYVAKVLTKYAGTTIYRIHEEPEEDDLMKIRDILKFHKIEFKIEHNINKTWQNVLECLPTEEHHRVFDRMILRSMKKAKYSTAHIAHFGLGIETYTHFTSPIRRLCDLVVHAQLKKFIFKKSVGETTNRDLTPSSVFNYAGIATMKEAIADESERAMEQKIVLSFMKKKVGQSFDGVIISFTNSAMIIELNDLPVRGVVKYMSLTDDYYELYDRIKVLKGRRKGKVFKLADKVKVQVNIVSEDIYFNIQSHQSTASGNPDKKKKYGKPKKSRRRKK